jgi:hypothetical protein
MRAARACGCVQMSWGGWREPGWGPRVCVLTGRDHCGQCFCLRVWVFPGSCAGPVRGCPWDRPRGSPQPRTYSGQRRHAETSPVTFAQVNGDVASRGGAVCKTVGSAYVGSNPTPATTCGNGPLAAETRPGGPFSSRHDVYRGVSLRVDALRCPRTYSGRRPGQDGRCAPSAFPRTATDRVRGVPILASRAALSRALAQGREYRGCPVCQAGSGGLRADLLPGVAPGQVDGFPGIRGHGRPRGGWRRVVPPAAVRASWRYRMQLPFRGRGDHRHDRASGQAAARRLAHGTRSGGGHGP